MEENQHVLLTGATGFVGRAVMENIVTEADYTLTVSVRDAFASFPSAVTVAPVDDLSVTTDWSKALHGVGTVVHLAARAHVLRETCLNPLTEFRRVNVDGTLELARQALAKGVQRFVFISSIGVNGALTTSQPFTEASEAQPHADYAVSKYEAEQGLWRLCKDSSMELVIIRPPLVYAGHAPGNFARLLKLVSFGIPLPFALVENQRSMIALDNLVDFIKLCISHPLAANQMLLVSDGEDLSTPLMLQHLAEGMGKSIRLLPVPVSLMRLGAKVLRREPMFNQLCGSLVVDSSKTQHLLNWMPPVSAKQAIRKAGQNYLNMHSLASGLN